MFPSANWVPSSFPQIHHRSCNARPEPYAIDEESPGPYVGEDGASQYVTEGSGVIATEYESSGN